MLDNISSVTEFIPLIYTMVINTDYTDYFMYTIGVIAVGYFIFELLKLHF